MEEPTSDQSVTTEAPETPAETASSEQPILVWESDEFDQYDRDHRWYVVVGVIGAVLAVGAILQAVLMGHGLLDLLSGVLVAIVFLLATYVVLRHADDNPRRLTYSITKLGINVGDTFYPYNELKLFWVIYKPPVKTLSIQRVNRFKPLIKANLAELDPLAVKNALKQYLPEDPKREEDLLDKFGRFIRL